MTGTELPVPALSWRGETQVVIVGSGAAGLACALPLAKAGVDTVLLTRARITNTATDLAQGGLAAAWSASDSPQAHADDTLTAGAGLCDQQAVRDLVTNAPAAIRRLVELGASFDRDPSGDYDLHLEGGHHARRILHAAGDASGREVQRTLTTGVLHIAESTQHLHVAENQRVIDLLADHQGVCGVRVLTASGEIGEWAAGAVVLASGGVGQLWPTTSNPKVSTGDGLTAAFRAGAPVRDLEFMQFHPTVLVTPGNLEDPAEPGALISEAVRGEGARLVDRSGTLVMKGVHPLGDLAPRDVVSAAMDVHLSKTGDPYLFLDATGFGTRVWESRFPGILSLCRHRGVDPITQPIPVRPAAHYMCGGIAADSLGRTILAGLYAVGEVAATGVQGANRLASNSVTEALVCGDRVGKMLTRMPSRKSIRVPLRRKPAALIDPVELPILRSAMARGCGVQRDEEHLSETLALLDGLATSDACLDNAHLTATNLGLAGKLVATAALHRRESRGCHRRSDYPATSRSWELRQVLTGDQTGAINVTTQPLGNSGSVTDSVRSPAA